mgnify:CR=1 FL=1
MGVGFRVVAYYADVGFSLNNAVLAFVNGRRIHELDKAAMVLNLGYSKINVEEMVKVTISV